MAGVLCGTLDFVFNMSLPGGADVLTAQGADDGFLAKYDPDGFHRLGEYQFGGAGSDRVETLDLDAAGNVYVAGLFNETADIGAETFVSQGSTDGFVAKLDPTGNVQWAEKLRRSRNSPCR